MRRAKAAAPENEPIACMHRRLVQVVICRDCGQTDEDADLTAPVERELRASPIGILLDAMARRR